MADKNEVEITLKGKFENGQLIIDTTKNVNKNLDEIGKSAQETEQKSNSLISTLKKIAAIVGITTLANQFKNLVKGSLQAAGSMEQVNIALTTMLGSAEKAKKLTADLVQFAKTTPFEIDGIFDTTKKLLAYGIAQEDIIKTLSTLGNIAAGVGTDLEGLAYGLGKVSANGKLTAEILNIFGDRGVPLVQALADVLNVTTKEVYDLVSQSKIGFPAVQKALESLSEEGGRFFNLMENQSRTFLGTVSNMSDSFFQVKAALGDALLPVAKQVVQSMIAWFSNLKTIIDNNKETITKFAQNAVYGFGLIGEAIKIAWGALMNFIAGLRLLLSIPFSKELILGTVLFFALTKGITAARIAFIALATTTAGWITIMIAAITAIGYFSRGFENLPDTVKIAVLKLQKIFELLKASVFDLIGDILDKLSLLSKLPLFGWIDDAKNKFEELRKEGVAAATAIEDQIKSIKENSQVSGSVNITSPTLPIINQPVSQQNLLAPEDPTKAENKRLKALKAENDALLEEQRNFLAGYGSNQSEADRLEIENQTLKLQTKILNDAEYKAKKDDLDQQLINNQITNEEYKQELEQLANDAKLEALQLQYDTELQKYQENQELLNQTKLQIQATQDEAELAALQIRQQREQALVNASEDRLVMFRVQASKKTYEQKKNDEEKALLHKLKMDSDEYKAAENVAGELVSLQNSKNKELAAIGKAAAIFQITNDTARGAIAAYSSLAPIPIVGPALGAAAAAALIAYGVERLSQVKANSFAVGTADVPQDQFAQIHAGEMIVPASFSEAIRAGELTLSGDGQGGAGRGQSENNIYISFDGANFVGIGDDIIAQIAQKMGEMIAQDLIPAIPTRTA